MKRFTTILLISALFIIPGCTTDSEASPEEKEVHMSFELNGEILTDDVPFGGRTWSTGEYTVYGIQVETVTYNTGNGEILSQPYAKGVFDDLSDLSIALIDGNEYVVEATAFRKGTAFGLATSHDGMDNSWFFDSPLNSKLENKFNYSTESTSYFLSNSTTYYGDADSLQTEFSFRPEITRFISPKITFFAEENAQIDVELVRANFGVEVYAENLTTGIVSLQIEDVNSNFRLDATSTSIPTKIIQFSFFNSLLNELGAYEEQMRVNVVYEVEIEGVQVNTPIFSGDVDFKKDYIKRIFVSVPDLSAGGKSDFSLTMEDIEMKYDSLYID